MPDKVLIDTNILVYIYDALDPLKQDRAMTIVDHLITTTRAVVSPQIMGEFFMATTRVNRPLLTTSEATTRIQHYLAACAVVNITRLITTEALRGVLTHHFRFWDAQIWATARLNQIGEIYSEDFSAGTTVEGVRFVNPLANDFQLP